MTPFVGITVRCLASSCFSASFGADSCDSAATCMSMTPHAQKASPQALVHHESAIHQSIWGEKHAAPGAPAGILIPLVLPTGTFASQDLDHASSKLGLICNFLSFPVISFHPVMLLLNRQMMSPNKRQLPHDRLHKFLGEKNKQVLNWRASPGASAGIAISLVLLTCTLQSNLGLRI